MLRLCECGCDLRARQQENPAEWRTRISRRLTRGNRLESLSSSRTIKFLPTHFLFLLFYFAKNVFVKHLCILKSTYCSAHLWRKKTYLSVFTGEAYYIAKSVFVGFVTLLIVSAFLVKKNSISQLNLPFQTLEAAEYLTRGLLSKLYLLLITCWRSRWNVACSDDTTALRPGGHRASSSTSPFRGRRELKNVFLYGRILWIWPHAVVVIYLLNLQKKTP